MSGNASFLPACDATASISTGGTASKRRRDEFEVTEVDRRPLVIRDSTDPFSRPKTFTPLCLLERAHLPLAYIDTTTSGSRLFSASIYTLESSHQYGSVPEVLLAQEEEEKRLYAIERVKTGTYALCRLHASALDSRILENAKGYVKIDDQQVKRRALLTTENDGPWWMRAAVDVPVKDGAVERATLPSLTMRRVMQAAQKIADTHLEPERPLDPTPLATEPLPQCQTPFASTTSPEDVLQDLARQYMEYLYIERTSLAYFAKGPLPRARAAFSTETKESIPADLIDFLRQIILTSATIDQKYRAGITEVVKELPTVPSQSPDNTAKRKSKWKKKWKPKRSKAGFFVYEDEYVERWWLTEEAHTDTVDETLRKRVPKLRMRETFLQLILALEVLALEDAHPAVHSGCQSIPKAGTVMNESQIDETQTTASQAKQPKSRAHKKQDLPALLDNILDKLCIWHSLESHSPAKARTGDQVGPQEESDDVLKSFCIEVIIPFYSSRIPKYATLVNKKLGGPSAPSPAKRRSTTTRKPGEPAARAAPEKQPRQPLARVSTDTLNRSSRHPPTLRRSATDSIAHPNIKREGTDTPPLLDLIPRSDGPQSRRQRVDPLERLAASTGRRVMDITAMSQASEAKLRKKAERAEMIKEAVEGIKKPKRALPEEQEKVDVSFAKAVAKGPKSHQRSRKAAAESTMSKFTATPSRHGARHVGVTPYKTVDATPSHAVDAIPSSASVVPATSTHLRIHDPRISLVSPSKSRIIHDDTHDDAAFAIPQTGHRPRYSSAMAGGSENLTSTTSVQDTPSRGFARFMPRGLATDPGTGTLGSPIARRKAATIVQRTPMKAPLLFDVGGIANTPVRMAHDAGTTLQSTLFPAPRVAKASLTHHIDDTPPEENLYAALGWDDAYEELA